MQDVLLAMLQENLAARSDVLSIFITSLVALVLSLMSMLLRSSSEQIQHHTPEPPRFTRSTKARLSAVSVATNA